MTSNALSSPFILHPSTGQARRRQRSARMCLGHASSSHGDSLSAAGSSDIIHERILLYIEALKLGLGSPPVTRRPVSRSNIGCGHDDVQRVIWPGHVGATSRVWLGDEDRWLDVTPDHVGNVTVYLAGKASEAADGGAPLTPGHKACCPEFFSSHPTNPKIWENEGVCSPSFTFVTSRFMAT